jgi:hypothetical protein
MDELIAAIAAKTGLPADKAKDAAQAALDFLKEKLPAPIAGQIEGFLSGNADKIGDTVGGVVESAKDMLGGMFGKG